MLENLNAIDLANSDQPSTALSLAAEMGIDPIISPDLTSTSEVILNPEEVFNGQQNVSVSQTDTLLLNLLNSKGIDPSAIKFEDEDGNIIEKSFDELSQEEQTSILMADDNDYNYGLEDHEVETINTLRENNITLQELIEKEKLLAIEDYKKSLGVEQQDKFEVDSYSDEELYLIDLKSRFDDLTEEELTSELEKATENSDLFKKKVDRLRLEYKELEKNILDQERLDREAEETAFITNLKNSLIDVANKTEDIHGLMLEDSDKESAIKAVVELDTTGKNLIAKALEDPEKCFKLAWFLTKGDEAFEALHEYYKSEISKASKGVKSQKVSPLNVIEKKQPEKNIEGLSLDQLNSLY